jgi:hypothetical protein
MKPTVGRIVHFKRSASSPQPLAAVVTFVHDDECLDLVVFLPASVADERVVVLPAVASLAKVRLGSGELEWSWPPMVKP